MVIIRSSNGPIPMKSANGGSVRQYGNTIEYILSLQ